MRGARAHARPPKEPSLQRFFSTFPGGWPGLGLLVLRAVVGAASLAEGGAWLAGIDGASLAPWALGVAGLVGGGGVLVGFLTPVAGGTVAALLLAQSLALVPGPQHGMPLDRVGALSVSSVSLALVLLGPGAFSLDARLFGLREIVFPPERRHPHRS